MFPRHGCLRPALRPRYGVAGAGLFLGMVRGAWHILANLWASATPAGQISPVFRAPAPGAESDGRPPLGLRGTMSPSRCSIVLVRLTLGGRGGG
jgi:hypothetical protein